ncbi:UBX domain-containing protein 1 [Echinops telfairi]|uniref:UBX domain-containing protein 1 n=1 Tax=Echinops telfairi TaxID=9371 RepID=A0AC55DN23_ECHTE|nr:UBX domain-containing protein 1 [Echinops telfairi]
MALQPAASNWKPSRRKEVTVFVAPREKALTLTGNQGIEAAMDWLMEHEEDPDVDEPLVPPLGHVLGAEPSSSEPSGPEGPGSTAEEKPGLSEEERQEQTKRMLELMAQKQRERGEREEREALERERQRRRQGQELSAARQRLQEDEMRRAAEERRREKAEELAARQRVREKIERDKAERAQKYGGAVASQPATEPGPVPSSPSQEPPAKREYDQCRIQVRLPDGTSLTQTFRAREQLAAVRLYVELHRGEEPGGDQDPVQLLSGFPRRAFSEADMERPLQDLGLVPSAVLIVAKKCPS